MRVEEGEGKMSEGNGTEENTSTYDLTSITKSQNIKKKRNKNNITTHHLSHTSPYKKNKHKLNNKKNQNKI